MTACELEFLAPRARRVVGGDVILLNIPVSTEY
jgi:hypothetical protein